MPMDRPESNFYLYSFLLRKPNAVFDTMFLSVMSIDSANNGFS